MRQTLFFIPHELAGVPVFGFGWLLGLLVVVCIASLVSVPRKDATSRNETRGLIWFFLLVAAMVVFVLPAVEVPLQVHEEAFVLWRYTPAPETPMQGLPIRGYGVFLLLATVSGVLLARHRAIQVGLSPDVIFNLAFFMFVGGIAGARTFFVIQYWNEIHDPNSLLNTIKNILNFVEGGLVVYGSLIGALIAGVFYLRRHGLPLLPIADLIAPSLALGLAIGRIGCLMNGCCFGGVSDVDWAIQFPVQSPVYAHQHRHGQFYGFQIQAGEAGSPIVGSVDPGGVAAKARLQAGETIQAVNGIPTENVEQAHGALHQTGLHLALQTSANTYRIAIPSFPEKSLPVHPTQLYSSLNALLLAGLAYSVFPFRRRDGEVFALLILAYAGTRFLLEVIRTDEGGFAQTGLTISQNVSVGMFLFVVVLAIYLSRQPRGTFWPEPAV